MRLQLYHGTIDSYAGQILRGIDLKKFRSFTDFGPGFYTTTVLEQARMWAENRAVVINSGRAKKRLGVVTPAVVVCEVDTDEVAELKSLSFVRGHRTANYFWTFVEACRSGCINHGCKSPTGYFDIVYGPVAAFWRQRSAMDDSDQISFHTQQAVNSVKLIRIDK